MQHVLVQGQHENDEDKQRVEDGEEEDGLVAELLQTIGNFFLGTKKYYAKLIIENYSYSFLPLLLYQHPKDGDISQ